MSSGASNVDLNLGTVTHGSKASGTLRIANKTDRTWRIARVESSCSCLKVGPASFEVAGGATTPIDIAFNFAEEPDFRGNLLVEVKGVEADGNVVFTSQVAVVVKD